MKNAPSLFKSLKNIGLSTVLASSLFLTNANAEEEKTSLLKKIARAGFELDSSVSAVDYSVDVPSKYIPSGGNSSKIKHEEYIEHKVPCGSGSVISFGPRARLFDIFEAAVRYNLSNLGIGRSRYETYWGGYGLGEYACIGAVDSKPKPFSYDLTLQTPALKTKNFGDVRLFTSYIHSDFDLIYTRGLHEYGEAFHTILDKFRVGEFKSEGQRFGIEVETNDGPIISLKAFYQQNKIKADTLSQAGKEFKISDKDHLIGVSLEYLF